MHIPFEVNYTEYLYKLSSFPFASVCSLCDSHSFPSLHPTQQLIAASILSQPLFVAHFNSNEVRRKVLLTAALPPFNQLFN